MEEIAIEWTTQVEKYINVVKLRGDIAINYGFTPYILRAILLRSACKIIEIVGKSNGRALPLENPPTKTGKEFVYMEVIFDNITNLAKFLEAMKNEFS